jgi:transposase-like protein
MANTKRYPVEVRERAVRLVLEHRDEYDTKGAAITSIAQKFGCAAVTLAGWVRQAEVDGGVRHSQERAPRTQGARRLIGKIMLGAAQFEMGVPEPRFYGRKAAESSSASSARLLWCRYRMVVLMLA